MSRKVNIIVNRAAVVKSGYAVCRGIALKKANGRAKGERPALNGGILINSNTGILNPFGINSGTEVTTNTIILDRIPPGTATINIPTEMMGIGNIHDRALSRVRMSSPITLTLYGLRRGVFRLRGRLSRLGGRGMGDRR